MVWSLKMRFTEEQPPVGIVISILLSVALFIGGLLVLYKIAQWGPTIPNEHFPLFSAYALVFSVLFFVIRTTKCVKGSLALQSQLKYGGLFAALLAPIFLSLYWPHTTFAVFYLGAGTFLIGVRSLLVSLWLLNIIPVSHSPWKSSHP